MKDIFIYDLVLCQEVNTIYGYRSKRLNIEDLIFTLEEKDFIDLMSYLYYFEGEIPIFAFGHNTSGLPWSKMELFIEQKYNLTFVNSDNYEDFI